MSKKFNKLLVPEGYRHYWSKYPEGYTILEALLNWVDSVNRLTDNVNDWNIYLEDFVENFDEKLAPTVREMLNEMDQDGRLAEIINETIFSELNDRLENIETRQQSLFINLKEFGAMGDSSTNDVEAFRAAVKYIYDNNIDALYIPAGTYILDEEITLPSNIRILGYNKENTIITMTSKNTNIFNISDKDHITIEHITMKGASENSDLADTGFGLFGDTVSHIDVRDCKFIDLSSGGISFKGNTSHVRIYDNFLSGNGSDTSQQHFDIRVYSDSEDVRISNNICLSENDIGIGVFYRYQKDVWITNNICRNHARHGILVGYGNGYLDNVHVLNNECSYNGWTGIYSSLSEALEENRNGFSLFHGNVCSYNGGSTEQIPRQTIRGGMYCAGFNIIISNNLTYENEGEFVAGIKLRGDNCLVTNNQIKDNNTVAIQIMSSHELDNSHTITNNVITNNHQGILIESSANQLIENVIIKDNLFRNNRGRAIQSLYTPTISIINNTIENNGGVAIRSGHLILGSVIENNHIVDVCKDLELQDSFAIAILSGEDTLIKGNYIMENDDNHRAGIYLTGSTNNMLVTNNIITNTLNMGIHNLSDNNHVYNNIVNNVGE